MGVVCECSLWGSCWLSTWGWFYWMLVIESNSVNSGTEVLIENVCIKWHVLQTYCFPSNEDCTLKKFWHEYLLLQKCQLISYKVIDYKHNIYNRDLFLFYFYTVQCKNLDPICLFSFLLVTKCFFLRGSTSQYSNELYLRFLTIFFFHCFQFCMSIIWSVFHTVVLTILHWYKLLTFDILRYSTLLYLTFLRRDLNSTSFISSTKQFSFCTIDSLPFLVVTSLTSKHS